jgi:glycerol-3-phosphate dehydrogenase
VPKSGPIVVIGAGINGAAVARELVLSGVPVVVVDADDIACGATAWSTRLVHGGLRYLEYGELGLVRESLAERDRLATLAPHLVRPLPFYLPLQRRLGGLRAAAARIVGWERMARRWAGSHGRGSLAVSIGLALYDMLAVGSCWPRHRVVNGGGPGLPRVDAVRFPLGATYADAQMFSPERFTVELLVDARRAAQEQGTTFQVHTHSRATLLADGTLRIRRRDDASAVGGLPEEIRPAAIINATGAWVDRTLAGLAADGAGGFLQPQPLIGGTKGSHLVVRCPPLRAALEEHGVYAEADDGRPVFVLPFARELVLIGTTDVPHTGDPDTARTDAGEIAYLLAATRRLFPQVTLTAANVQQHYCGVRPLPASTASGAPAAVTRRHMLIPHSQALLPAWSIVGGKLTTCRSLAETAARTVLGRLGLPVRGSSRARPLPGAWQGRTRQDVVRETAIAAGRSGVPAERTGDVADRIVELFGSRGPDIFTSPRAGRAAGRLLPGSGLPVAAVDFCVREEWAGSLEDLVERRLLLAFDGHLSLATLAAVAAELASLGLLPVDRVAGEAAAVAGRMAERFGKHISPD